MEAETIVEGAETAASGDIQQEKPLDDQKTPENVEASAPEAQVETGEPGVIGEAGEQTEGGTVAGTDVTEGREGGEVPEGTEAAHSETVEGEHIEGENLEEIEYEYIEVETEESEEEGEEKVAVGEGEELEGEGLEGEGIEGEEVKEEEDLLPPPPEEEVEEEQAYIEEPPPDPAAPYDFSDSKEALKAPFELRPDQLAEVEQLWEMYQNHTPAYADLDGFITEVELVYMLKCLLLMTYTAEQLQELITYCCRPPHPKGHIFFDQFVKMVTIRQRDFPIEEEIRCALKVFDPENTGIVDRENLKDVLSKLGHKMPHRQLDHLIKEVDISNDGTIGIEDVVGTMCIDLNPDDLQMLRAAVYPPGETELPDIAMAGGDDDDD